MASVIETFARHNIPLSDTIISDGYGWVVSEGGEASLKEDGGRQMIASITGVDVA